NRGIEADNDGSNPAAEPMSSPTLANLTIIGNTFAGEDSSEGIYLREGTQATFYNTIVSGPAGMGECLEVESNPVSQGHLQDGGISMTHSVMACDNGENFKFGTSDVDLEQWFLGQQGNSVVTAAEALDGIFTATDAAAADLSGDTFFDNADFVGAVSADNDWTAGWTVGLE
ncbi:MAG TPA: hypothetical protein DCF92_05320, partial [Idiomarina sp.]|nr:hypothetical protein [Idiomarina sp.]